ncbi:MAG: PQQ-dependent sugar dehydrogenase [Proteobacteria bacterium]|nr:PQQ-dependent sugar dehydrogenase [Pseudomonadota bacterium]
MTETLANLLSWALAWPGTPLLLLAATAAGLGAMNRTTAAIALVGLAVCAQMLPRDHHALPLLGVALAAVAGGWFVARAAVWRFSHRPVGRSVVLGAVGVGCVALAWRAGGVGLAGDPGLGAWARGWPGTWLLLALAAASTNVLEDYQAPYGDRRAAFLAAGIVTAAAAIWLAGEGRVRILEASAAAAVLGGVFAALAVGPDRALSAMQVAVLAIACVAWSAGVHDSWGTGEYIHPAGLERTADPAAVEVVHRGVALTSGLAVAPDGRVFYSEFTTGRIGMLTETDGLWDEATFATVPLPDVASLELRSAEAGLWGLAVDPAGTALFAMAADTLQERDGRVVGTSRVLRFPLTGGEPTVVLGGLPAGAIHNGGVLAFAPDGELWVTVGDGDDPDAVGRPGSAAGSIVAVAPSGHRSDVAHGFRNLYGLTFDPATGTPWATDNGGACCDRVLRIQPGRDHGWPRYGASPADAAAMVSDPAVAPSSFDSGTSRIGPTGVVFVDPERYDQPPGTLLFGTWHTSALHRMRVTANGRALAHDIVLDLYGTRPPEGSVYPFAGGFSALTAAPDGTVWFATLDAVGRLRSLPAVAP